MSKIEVNTIDTQCGSALQIGDGNTATIGLGKSGDTITIPSGATIVNSGTQTGFGREGSVDWNTTKITADPANAVSGTGYFCDTSGAAFTVTLPTSPSAGDIVSVSDYTRTFETYNLTIGRSSKPIGGIAADAELKVNGQSATFVFVDDTEGWINIQETQTSQTGTPPFVVATGGTITTSGDDKIHTFTGPGTFCVSNVSPTPANNAVAYMVVSGGGGGGGATGNCNGGSGGGGGGGFREGSTNPITPYTASPLAAACSGITVTASPYAITVGGGGEGKSNNCCQGGSGNDSIFSTITSAGGGGGGTSNCAIPKKDGTDGGSGGGGGAVGAAGAGDIPNVTPDQGFPGGAGGSGAPYASGGGGGATVAGTAGAPSGPNAQAGPGGTGATTSINATPTAYAGGGGGGGRTPSPSGGVLFGTGGTGGGGRGCGPDGGGVAGGCNTGGGGGGAETSSGSSPTAGVGLNGGSGVVIIRYKFQ